MQATTTTSSTSPAVDQFGHKAWKTTPFLSVGAWDPSAGDDTLQIVSLSTKEMGQRCHELDEGIRQVDTKASSSSSTVLRPPDRDGQQRPLQPGELDLQTVASIPWDSSPGRPWYVPFCVMPNMNDHGALFDRWEELVLDLVNQHKLPDTHSITDLSQAHQVLPHPGTKAFGMDLHLQAQRWLADRLTAEWNGSVAENSWLDLYTETIRLVVQPFMEQYYGASKFYVQKHPKNLRLQMPGMKSVQHWHCDHMFAHPQGEINFSLCLTEFKTTAGICLELQLPPNDGDTKVFPILAGAGSIVVAPFGYCPHGNLVNTEREEHTRVSIDWRIITLEDMDQEAKKDLGASATSGLLYAPGAYYGLWDAARSDWVEGPKPPRGGEHNKNLNAELPASE